MIDQLTALSDNLTCESSPRSLRNRINFILPVAFNDDLVLLYLTRNMEALNRNSTVRILFTTEEVNN